jgi:hypothetical protein
MSSLFYIIRFAAMRKNWLGICWVPFMLVSAVDFIKLNPLIQRASVLL